MRTGTFGVKAKKKKITELQIQYIAQQEKRHGFSNNCVLTLPS